MSDKIVYIVHCVDTEGPLYESLEATSERIYKTFGLEYDLTPDQLTRLRQGLDLPEDLRDLVMDFVSEDRLKYNTDWSEIDDEKIRAGKLVQKLNRIVESGAASRDRVDEIGAFLGRIFAIEFGTDWDVMPNRFSPEQLKNQIFYALRDLFVALAKERPLILVLEDLHKLH